MPRKTKYRIRRQKKNKTKRRIKKFFRGKTYKKLYNNRRFTGGMIRTKLAAAAAAAAAAAGVAYLRGAPVVEVNVPKTLVSTDPAGYVAPISVDPVTNAPSHQHLQESTLSTLSPIPQSRSHTRFSPPRSPPSLFYPPPPSPRPLPSPRPSPSDIIHTSPMEKSSLLKQAQINEGGNVTVAPGYSQTKSTFLEPEPPTEVVEKTQQNLAPNRSKDLIILPEIFPSIYGVNWTTIMSNLLEFYEDLGQTLGKYEVHLIMTTDDLDESDRIRSEVIARIEEDIKRDVDGNFLPGNFPPWFDNLKKYCQTAICNKYEAKNGKIRYLLNIDLGSFFNNIEKYPDLNTYFNTLSNEDKEEYILSSLCYFMAHEYYHIFQLQLISPVIDPNRFGAEDIPAKWGTDKNITSGEKQPHAISRWWTESFATIMPFFLGASLPEEKGMLERVKNAIRIIKSDKTLTAKEFVDRMMYRFTNYGYLFNDERQDWAFLAAACMAQQTSWTYLLAGHFYKDFQRIKSDTFIKKDGNWTDVPDADRIWLHNFRKTQKAFLRFIFDQVRSGKITVDSLRDVLPGGINWHIDTYR